MTGVRLGVSDLEGTLVVHRLVEGSIDRGVAAVIGAVEQGGSPVETSSAVAAIAAA